MPERDGYIPGVPAPDRHICARVARPHRTPVRCAQRCSWIRRSHMADFGRGYFSSSCSASSSRSMPSPSFERPSSMSSSSNASRRVWSSGFSSMASSANCSIGSSSCSPFRVITPFFARPASSQLTSGIRRLGSPRLPEHRGEGHRHYRHDEASDPAGNAGRDQDCAQSSANTDDPRGRNNSRQDRLKGPASGMLRHEPSIGRRVVRHPVARASASIRARVASSTAYSASSIAPYA